MKKKFFVSLLAVMLVIVSLCQTAFADFMDDVKQSPNAVVMVSEKTKTVWNLRI